MPCFLGCDKSVWKCTLTTLIFILTLLDLFVHVLSVWWFLMIYSTVSRVGFCCPQNIVTEIMTTLGLVRFFISKPCLQSPFTWRWVSSDSAVVLCRGNIISCSRCAPLSFHWSSVADQLLPSWNLDIMYGWFGGRLLLAVGKFCCPSQLIAHERDCHFGLFKSLHITPPKPVASAIQYLPFEDAILCTRYLMILLSHFGSTTIVPHFSSPWCVLLECIKLIVLSYQLPYGDSRLIPALPYLSQDFFVKTCWQTASANEYSTPIRRLYHSSS